MTEDDVIELRPLYRYLKRNVVYMLGPIFVPSRGGQGQSPSELSDEGEADEESGNEWWMMKAFFLSNHMTCAGLRLILEARPALIMVGEASMPHVALAPVAHEKPDIILVDLDLYGMHVLRLIKILRKRVLSHTS